MKAFFLLLFSGYLCCCLALFFLQRQMIYYPTPVLSVGHNDKVQFASADLQLSGWRLNAGRAKALIYYGGNAEQIEANINEFKQLFPQHTIYLVPYRGYSNNPGQPSEAALYEDALAVFDQLQPKYGSIDIIGRSLGSGVATYVAAHRNVGQLALITPYDSIERIAQSTYWIFPVQLLLKDKFKSEDWAAKISSPSLVIVAEQDQVIPHRHSERLYQSLASEEKRYRIISEAEHNDISHYADYQNLLFDFFNNQTTPDSPEPDGSPQF